MTLENPSKPYYQNFTDAVDRQVSKQAGLDPQKVDFVEALDEIEMYIRGKDRIGLLRSIKDAKVDIFGSAHNSLGWKKYLGDRRNFVIHDPVPFGMWAKLDKPGSIYYDITWVGYIGDAPSKKYLEMFNTVKAGRNAAIALVKDRFAKGKAIGGWEVDDACRNVVKKAGYAKYFVHRTGHSIGEEVHGNGVNIDNLETKDERQLMPGTCFSVEPGIYLPHENMAARTEINMFVRHDGVPEVTGEMQDELVRI